MDFCFRGVEPGELPEDAITREIFEETGLKVDSKSKIGELIVENLPNSTIEVFNCTCSGKVFLGDKIKAIGMFDKKDLPTNMDSICNRILELIQSTEKNK